jgi:membrane glycosyltransferase
LQHARLLLLPGLHPVNRLHLWLGVMAYMAAPLWMLMLVISTIEGIRESVRPHPYFPLAPALHPIWKISVQQQAVWLFLVVMGLLMAPKLLSLLIHLRNREERAAFGGGDKLVLSVLLETVASTLLAPVLAFLQTHFVAGVLMGKNVKWDAQDRGEAQTTLKEAIRRHWPSTLLGAVWSFLLLTTAPKLFWWFSPVLAGFWLAIPISFWSSRVSLGERARKHGLFLTPEETDPPPILVTLERELEIGATSPWTKEEDALERVLGDPVVRAVHFSLLGGSEPKDELRHHYLEGLELKYCHDGATALTPREKRDLLWDEHSIRSLLNRSFAGRSPPHPRAEYSPHCEVAAQAPE